MAILAQNWRGDYTRTEAIIWRMITIPMRLAIVVVVLASVATTVIDGITNSQSGVKLASNITGVASSSLLAAPFSFQGGYTMAMTNVAAIKRYFDASFDELKALDSDDRKELGALCRSELSSDGE